MATSVLQDFQVEKIKLHVPPFQDIANALQNGLSKNFAHVDVAVTECPDLTLPPYNLVSKGLGGNPSVLQIGDPSNFILLDYKVYDFRYVPKALGLDSLNIFGAGCGLTCVNTSELWANVKVKNDQVQNFSKDVFTRDKTPSGIKVEPVNINETRFSAVGNLFASDGLPGQVIRISCKRRTGKDDFLSSIINSLNDVFTIPIALGVVFTLKNGKAQVHVAPEKPLSPLKNTANIMKWFLLPIVSPPYTAVGTILSRNPPGWDVQPFHLHGCNEKEGGHFHYDITPEEVEYEAHVMPAETLCTIDRAAKALSLLNYEL